MSESLRVLIVLLSGAASAIAVELLLSRWLNRKPDKSRHTTNEVLQQAGLPKHF
jgi:hypothetical protein